jgi:hypothetical protein
MKHIVKFIYILMSIIFVLYMVSPIPDFPDPPQGFLQSDEPADTESKLRRAYFVNQNRNEVIKHYRQEFKNTFFAMNLFVIGLNHPPEYASLLIRDQTRSTYLEEIVIPLKASIYINGFEPKEEKDTINIGGKIWEQKIIVKYSFSTGVERFISSMIIIVLIPLTIKVFAHSINALVAQLLWKK